MKQAGRQEIWASSASFERMARYLGMRRKFGRKAKDLGKKVQKLGTRCEIWRQGAIFGQIFGHEAQIWVQGARIAQRGAKIGHKVRDLGARHNIWA